MTTTAKGAVDIDTVWLDVKTINGFFEQHRNMLELFAHLESSVGL